VVALCQAPFLLDDPNVGLIFPADAIARAKHYLAMAPGGLGNIYHIVVKKNGKRLNLFRLTLLYQILIEVIRLNMSMKSIGIP
jgi:hypothetical protein